MIQRPSRKAPRAVAFAACLSKAERRWRLAVAAFSLALAMLAPAAAATPSPGAAAPPPGFSCRLHDGTPFASAADLSTTLGHLVRDCERGARQGARLSPEAAGTTAASDSARGSTTQVSSGFHCRFHDGRVTSAAQDLAPVFPDIVAGCTARMVLVEAHTPGPLSATGAAIEGPGPGRGEQAFGGARPRPGLQRGPLEPLLAAAGARHRVDVQLLQSLVHVESRGQTRAVSPKGALGAMQIMPATARRYGVHDPSTLMDPWINIEVGTRYLRDLLRLFDGSVTLALAAYNAGEGAVIRYGRAIPPYPETQAYVRDVLQRYRVLSSPGGH